MSPSPAARLSATEHAYQPQATSAPPARQHQTAAASAVALSFALPRSHGDSLTIAAWTLQGEKHLVYALFQDTLPGFDLLLSWLRQWRAPSVHWAFQHQGKKNAHAQICQAVKEWMTALTEKLAESDEGEDAETAGAAAPLQASVTFHESALFKDSHRTIPALLQNLVQGNSAAQYALAANVDLSSSSSNSSKASPLCSALAVLWYGLGYGMTDEAAAYEISPAARAPFLVLDRAAASSLNLWPVAHQGQAAAQGVTTDKDSLYGLLAKPCATAGGKRLLKQWLQQPLTCLATLQQRQAAVAHLVTAGVERDSLRAVALSPLQIDLAALARKLGHYEACADEGTEEKATSSNFGSTRQALQTLYELYLVASQKIPAIAEQVQQVGSLLPEEDGNDNTLWKTWTAALPTMMVELQRSVSLAEAVLDLNQAPREFLVQASYQPDLLDLQEELENVQVEADNCHAEMNQLWAEVAGLNADSQVVRLEYDTTDSTWQFRLPQTNDSKVLQNQLGNRVTVHRLLKNGVYFSTKSIRQLSCQRRDLLANYDRLQRQIARDALQVASTYHSVVSRLSRVVSHIDVIAALAHTAAYQNYCRPELTDTEEDGVGIDLEQARHPCVELQDNVEYIPNNVRLIFGESSFLIVTGPNMGGKSTYIRALGASIVLAQIGSFVPATKARINICHHLLARVGAGDLPDRGISTFMAEMIEASSILRQASRRSLIMIDELGRGTSTFDGYGLARAIAEYIVDEIGCLTVFATHFHELTALDEKAVVRNGHVTAQKGQHGLTFLYQVRPGPCLESFGIQVAEMANFPNIVVQDAKRKASELERFEYSHQSADSTEDTEAYLDRFRSLDLPSILAGHSTNEDKKTALLQAMQA
jgi:DNA mismatch repair protein MSH2